MKTGLIGLGRMGLAMVTRLQTQGHGPLLVWDRDPARVRLAQDAGAGAGSDACDVAERSDTVLTIINDDAGVHALYTGPRGLLSGNVAGKLFVEMSTLQPRTVRDLGALVSARGASLLGAPVMGTIPSVRDGKLFMPVGGSAADLERAAPVLAALTRRVKLVGPLGAGNAMKLATNLTMAAFLQALTEGLAMGLAEGLDIDTMLEVLAEGPVANNWFNAKVPMLKGGSSETTLDISSLRKDMQSAVATGALNGVPMAMTAALVATLSAAVAGGIGGDDIAQLPRFFRDRLLQSAA